MGIAQVDDDAGHDKMELRLAHVRRTRAQQLKRLHRVIRISGALLQQVTIRAADRGQQGIHDGNPFRGIQLVGGGPGHHRVAHLQKAGPAAQEHASL